MEFAVESSILQSYHNTCNSQIELNQTQNGDPLLPTDGGAAGGTFGEPISWEQQFQNIAPHLIKIDTYTNSTALTTSNIDSTSTTLILNSNFTPLYDNFYLSDVITKASITMGKCASQSRNNGDNNFF